MQLQKPGLLPGLSQMLHIFVFNVCCQDVKKIFVRTPTYSVRSALV